MTFSLPGDALTSQIGLLEALVEDLLASATAGERPESLDRASRIEAMHRMEPGSSGRPIFPNWEVRPTPLLTSRIDRLTGSVWAGLTAAAPYCQAAPDVKEQELADALESGIQKALERGAIEESLRTALRDAALAGVGLIWTVPAARGLWTEAVHPSRFVMLPHYAPSLKEASFCGHSFHLPRWRVDREASEGKWRSEPLVGGDLADPGFGDWEAIELWHLLARLQIGDRDGWWSIIYSPASRRILHVEPYALERPWYVEVRIHTEGRGWWPTTSLGSRLEGLQHSHTQLCAIREQGTMFSAFGLMVGPDGLKSQITTFSPGQVLRGTPGFPIQAIFPPFNPSISLELIAQIEQQADAAVGISRLGTGQELGNATATEAAFLKAVTEQAENSYASTAARGLEQAFELAHQLFVAHPTALGRALGATLDGEFWRALRLPVRWKSTGRSLDNAPSVQMDRLKTALALSRQPGSVLDPAKTEKATLQALQLPVQLEQLLRENQQNPNNQ